MVGHTHEAVDRYFAFINRQLTKLGNVMTADELAECIKHCVLDGREFRVDGIDWVGDWKEWMKGCHEPLHDHTGKGSALHWRFQRDEEGGPVLLRTKHLVSDELWIPREGLQLVNKVPTGLPEAAGYFPLGRENSTTYIRRLTKTVSLLESNHFVDDVQLAWWKKTLREETMKEVPAQYNTESEKRQSFPTRNETEDADAARRLADAAFSSQLTENDRRNFGQVQFKEPYTGKSQSRTKRSCRAANQEEMVISSFIMVRGADPKEPLMFGKVVKLYARERRCDIHYYSRTDETGCDVSGRFTPRFTGTPHAKGTKGKKGKRGKTTKHIGPVDWDSIMCFDIETKKVTKTGLLSLSKRGIEMCREQIEELGDFGDEGDDGDQSSEESDDSLDNLRASDSEDESSDA
jgi:hypothetical protein